jgi:hypothetical protein
MGGRASSTSKVWRPALAGAVLSSVATVVLLGVVVGAADVKTLRELAWPLMGFTTNAVTKAVIAFVTGGPRFATWVWAGLVAMTAAAWAGYAATAGV